jgi:hypothetical protein
MRIVFDQKIDINAEGETFGGVQNFCEYIEDYLEVLTCQRNLFRGKTSEYDNRIKKMMDEDIRILTNMWSILYTLEGKWSEN